MPTPVYTFVADTVINPSQVNANFQLLEDCYDADGGDIGGSITPSTDNTYDLGSLAKAWRLLYARAVGLVDTNQTHILKLIAGSNLTADRTLTLTTGDANRTLTVGADSSISGTAYVVGGTDVALADGGTGASLADPGADRIMFWDDSEGTVAFLTAGSGLSIVGDTITATGGLSISGSDNQVVRLDGTNGVQGSDVVIADGGDMTIPGNLTFETLGAMIRTAKSFNTAYLAASDGFVIAIGDAIAGGGGTGTVQVLTDSSNPPTTVCGKVSLSNEYGTLTVPVKKGDYYKVTATLNSGTAITSSAEWVPLGTAG